MCYNPGILATHGEYVRDWYEETGEENLGYDPAKITWDNILSHWDALETDFHITYGVDLTEDEYRWGRSWSWFKKRVLRLLSEESAIEAAIDLFPQRRKRPDRTR